LQNVIKNNLFKVSRQRARDLRRSRPRPSLETPSLKITIA